MGSGRVITMGRKICEVSVAGITLTTCQMPGSVSFQGTSVEGMTAITIGMGLSTANEWGGGRGMTVGRGAVYGCWDKDRVYFDRCRMLCM